MKRIQYQLLLAVTRRGWQHVAQEAADLSAPLAAGYCDLTVAAEARERLEARLARLRLEAALRRLRMTPEDYEQECSRA